MFLELGRVGRNLQVLDLTITCVFNIDGIKPYLHIKFDFGEFLIIIFVPSVNLLILFIYSTRITEIEKKSEPDTEPH